MPSIEAAACYSVLAVVTIAAVNLAVLVTVSNKWEGARNTVDTNTVALINNVFPDYSCINKSDTFVGYLCRSVSFECNIENNKNSYKPVCNGTTECNGNWIRLLEALYSCNAVYGWNNNNTVYYEQGTLDNLTAAFNAFKDISGIDYGKNEPALYTEYYYGSSGQKNGNGPNSFFTMQLVDKTVHNFFNVLIHQKSDTPSCLNDTFTLNQSHTYNCKGKPWYVSAPYCAHYYCQHGVKGPHLANYQILHAASAQNVTIEFAGLRGDFDFITALYTGAITNAYASFAVICAIIFSTASLVATVYEGNNFHAWIRGLVGTTFYNFYAWIRGLISTTFYNSYAWIRGLVSTTFDNFHAWITDCFNNYKEERPAARFIELNSWTSKVNECTC